MICDRCEEMDAEDRLVDDTNMPDTPWFIGHLCLKCWEQWLLTDIGKLITKGTIYG